MSKDHDDTWWWFTPPLGMFCLLKNNSLTFSLNWFLSVDVNVSAWGKKGVIAATLGRERFQSFTLAMTGIMLTLVWSPSMTSISRGLFAVNYIFMIWWATPNCITSKRIQLWLQYPKACLQSIIYSWYDELRQIVLQAQGYNYDFNIQRHVCKQLWCE